MSKIWGFVNSKLGLLLLGFLLTTVAGSYLVQEFQRASRLEELRFTYLHEEQVRAVKDLHKKIVEVERVLTAYYYTYRPIGIAPETAKPEEVIARIRELRLLFDERRLYFGSELASRIDSLCTAFEESFRALEVAELQQPRDRNFVAPDFAETQFSELMGKAESARGRLDQEFRRLLGVN